MKTKKYSSRKANKGRIAFRTRRGFSVVRKQKSGKIKKMKG